MSNGPRNTMLLGAGIFGLGLLWRSRQQSAQLGNLSLANETPYASTGKLSPTTRGKGIQSMKLHPAGNINNRLKFIIEQIRSDSLDPRVVTEARTIVSKKCSTMDGGKRWCIPVKNWKGEIAAIFNAVTNPNSPMAVRYTRDHAKVDMFASSALMRRLPAEDCFVHGTLVLRDDHKLVPVETLRVGDRIWGLDKWTTVQQTWDKGVLPTWLIRLNNGSSMRLTPDHKVWILECPTHPKGTGGCSQQTCPLERRVKKVVRVRDLTPEMTLIQPNSVEAGTQEIDPEEAWIEGIFAADGWIQGRTRFCIAGKDGHPKEAQKHRVKAFFDARGIKTTWHPRYLYVYSKEWVERLSALGKGAPNKRVSSLAYTAPAVERLVEGVLADAAYSKRDQTHCLTTTSRTLFTQMRVLMKIRGVTCSERFITDHGGLGKNPIWRLQERVKGGPANRGSKALRVKEIVRDGLELPCFDFATEDHNIWLPEADWTVHNCDGMTIRTGALLRAIGYSVKARIVAPAGAPNQWAHIYLAVGTPPGEDKEWIPLDVTEPHGPGWEVPAHMISSKKDYEI